MNYEEFEDTILAKLNNDNKSCLDTIENYKKVIYNYLKDTEKPIHIKEFVDKLNIIVIKKKNFDLIENVLKHDLFSKVLNEFRHSNILIKACQNNNLNAASWLLTMNIDKYVQDEYGMTALMHAAHHSELISIVEKLINNDDDSIHLTDNNDETALFHAVNNIDILSILLNSEIDVNHQNKNGDTVLIYCCKNELMYAVDKIIKKSNINLNLRNFEDRNAVMYLVENGKYNIINFLSYILKKNRIELDVNYRNKNNETLVSILISQFRKWYYSENIRKEGNKILVYAYILMYLIDSGCDFNAPIDEEGNTPIMFFMMVGDYCSAYYILQNYEKIDLSIKNNKGISATLLSLSIKESNNFLKQTFLKHKAFDIYSQDEHRNNPLMYYLINRNSFLFSVACNEINSSNKEKVYSQINDKNENIIIIATKLGLFKYLFDIVFSNNNIDHQDNLGNTALYYAIKIKDKYAINSLIYRHANLNIKNNQGKSAFDLSKEINDDSIIEILNNPISPEDFEKNEKKKSKKILFFKKKENSDEKLEKYIQNYQIGNYQNNDYDYILKEEKNYSYLPPQEFKDNQYIKYNLWIVYSKQGTLDIRYNKDKMGNRQSLSNAIITLNLNIKDDYYSRNYNNYIEVKKCPF